MSTPESSSSNSCPPLHTIAWNELVTSNVEGAVAFYGSLFGWTTEKYTGGPTEYLVFKNQDRMFGGVMALPHPGIPPHWMNYVVVTSLEESVEKAKSLGGGVCLEPMSIGQAGRIAIITDPQGAAIGLHEVPPMAG